VDGDDPLLDLAGAFEDRGEACIAPVAFGLAFRCVAVAAEELDRRAGDLDGHLGGQ